jgi:hypothetical protein
MKKDLFHVFMAVRLDNISLELKMGIVLPIAVQVGPTKPRDVGYGNQVMFHEILLFSSRIICWHDVIDLQNTHKQIRS